MYLYWIIICSVTVIGLTHGDPVIDGAVEKPDGTLYIQGSEGKSLMVTCLSNFSTLYLVYNNTMYNDSVITNGTSSVSFTIKAERYDDGKNVTCHSVNTTSGDEFETQAIIYLKLKPISIYMTGNGTYEEGENMTITCNVKGSRPAATFQELWIGFNIVPHSDVQVSVDYNNMTDTYDAMASVIKTADRSLNGMSISCSVYVGSARFYSNFIGVNVYVHYGPDKENVRLSGPETGNEGSAVTFRCEIEGNSPSTGMNPAPTIYWLNNTETINTTTQAVITKKQTSGFHPVTYYAAYHEWDLELSRYHIGSEIKCVVMGTGNRSVTLTKNITDVYYKPIIEVTGAPLIDPDTGHYVYDEGDTLNLTCNLREANPPTTVKWIDQTDSGLSVSFVHDIKTWDNGKYFTCLATNKAGSVTRVITLYVQYGPNIRTGYKKVIEEGNNVTHTCEVDSNPPAKIWWLKKGDNSFNMDGNELAFINIEREQGGDYLCVASTNRTRENGTMEVILANETFPIDVQYGPGNSIRLSPNITSLDVTEGSSVPRIQCIADCNPPCAVYWLRSGSNEYLTINQANHEYHIGKYTCEASNDVLGTRYETNTSIVLHIRYKPVIERVRIDKVNWYDEGSPVEVTCKVKSYPESNITWSMNFGEVIPSGTYTVSNIVKCHYDCETTSTMTVTQANCLDSGSFYTCGADNGIVGHITETSLDKMKVRCHPRLEDSSLISVNNYTLQLKDSINMTASFFSIPGPRVTWLFRATPTSENRTLPTSDDWSSDWNQKNFTSVWTIDSLMMHNFGQYLAVANSFGSDIKSTVIYNIILNRDGFPDKPHSLSASCSESSAVFSWISPNNGGNNQTFSTTYGYFNPPVIKDRTGIPDPGENLTVTVTIQLEKIVHTFFFTVKTVNQFGYTEADDIVNCTTGGKTTGTGRQTSNNMKEGVIAGAVIGSLMFVAIVVVVGFFLYWRHKSQQGNVKFADLHLSFYNK